MRENHTPTAFTGVLFESIDKPIDQLQRKNTHGRKVERTIQFELTPCILFYAFPGLLVKKPDLDPVNPNYGLVLDLSAI